MFQKLECELGVARLYVTPRGWESGGWSALDILRVVLVRAHGDPCWSKCGCYNEFQFHFWGVEVDPSAWKRSGL